MNALEKRIAGLDRCFDAIERNDLDGLMEIIAEICDPEVEFTSGIGTALSGGSFHGHDDLRRWFAELLETLSEIVYAQRRYEPVGDDALLFFAEVTATGASSRLPIRFENGQLFVLEDGRFVRGWSYASYAEARAAAEALHA